MGNSDYFISILHYYFINLSVDIFFLTEFVILMFSLIGSHKQKEKKKSDGGTVVLIVFAVLFSIFISTFFESQTMPLQFRSLLLPYCFYFIGEAFIFIGIAIRITAIVTLKHSFTLTVQTANNQHLIQTGLYKIVRNPAYTGSIVSVIGIALAYRHIVAVLAAIIILFVCYGARIRVEEKALASQFGSEFTDYCKKTRYRIFPFIY